VSERELNICSLLRDDKEKRKLRVELLRMNWLNWNFSFLNSQKPTAFGCCAKPHLRD